MRTKDADDFSAASQPDASSGGPLFEMPANEPSQFFRNLGAHGVPSTVHTPNGWAHCCVCGFQTPESESLELAGKSFDEHLK
ncbi:MAG: hypothetical protein KGL39_51635 [Patescibacteria group bacterium]|nr:hypothetical protein [Patescibacteria group bacterium]